MAYKQISASVIIGITAGIFCASYLVGYYGFDIDHYIAWQFNIVDDKGEIAYRFLHTPFLVLACIGCWFVYWGTIKLLYRLFKIGGKKCPFGS